jgi:hypothetical protein
VQVKPGISGDLAEVKADVARSDDVEVRGWEEWIDMDIHPSTANQAVLLREVVIQLVVDDLRSPVVQREAGFPDRIVLVAAPADRPHRATVGEDKHLRTGALRRGPLGADHRHERGSLTALQCVGRGSQDVFVQKRTSIFALFLTAATNACC